MAGSTDTDLRIDCSNCSDIRNLSDAVKTLFKKLDDLAARMDVGINKNNASRRISI
jgi:hypothetical protein